MESPETSEEHIARAVRVIATLEGAGEMTARRSLHDVADRAGVSDHEIARGVLLFHTRAS